MKRTQDLPKKSVLAGCLIMCVLTLAAPHAWAVGEPVNGFPNWAERVIHEWVNRARVDPQVEINACGSPCVEGACYTPMPPLTWTEALNRSARFHSDEMIHQGYFAHNSACTLVSNINSIYPTSCDGSASCACVGGTVACSPTCTGFAARVQMFGGSPSGEIIASPSDPNYAFYLWMFEQGDTTTCKFTSANGHRWLILKSIQGFGAGVAGYSTGDFGVGDPPTKIPSGAHYPQQGASVDVWANWYDSAGPSVANVNVDGTCQPMTLRRGTQTNGAWTTTLTGFASGCHRYFFSFQDASGMAVTYPTTGSLAIGSGTACPDWDSTRPPDCGPSPLPSPTSTATPSQTRTATPTVPPTSTPSRTATRTPTLPPTATPTRTRTFTPTRTATVTATLPPTSSPTRTATPVPTLTPTPTLPPTATPSRTATATPTFTAVPSPTSVPSSTPVATPPDVSGYVMYYSNGMPVPDAMVHAVGTTMASESPTDTSGRYMLSELPSEDVNVYPDMATTGGSAVSALDAAYVLQSLVGLRPFSAQQRLACDVTGNGSLSALDAAMILQHVVGLLPSFPVATGCNSNWVFIPDPGPAPNQALIEPQPGANSCTAGALSYHPLAPAVDQQNFLALLFGDCTGNWQPPLAGAVARSAPLASAPVVHASQLRPLRGRRLALPIWVDTREPVFSLNVRVEYDAAVLRAVSARTVGAARGAALAVNTGDAGVVRIALARAEAIDGRRGPLLLVMFEVQSRDGIAEPSVSGQVNDD